MDEITTQPLDEEPHATSSIEPSMKQKVAQAAQLPAVVDTSPLHRVQPRPVRYGSTTEEARHARSNSTAANQSPPSTATEQHLNGVAVVSHDNEVPMRALATADDNNLLRMQSTDARRLPSFYKQFRAILYHCFLMKLRNPIHTLLELLVPVAFVGLIILFKYIQSTRAGTASTNTVVQSYEPHDFNNLAGINGTTYGFLESWAVQNMIYKVGVAPDSPTTRRVALNALYCYVKRVRHSDWDIAGDDDDSASVLMDLFDIEIPDNKRFNPSEDLVMLASRDDVDKFIFGVMQHEDFNITHPFPVGIIFGDSNIAQPEYTLRYPWLGNAFVPGPSRRSTCGTSSLIPVDLRQPQCWKRKPIAQNMSEFISFRSNKDICDTESYIRVGYIVLQHCIDIELMRLHSVSPSTFQEPRVKLRMMPKQVVVDDENAELLFLFVPMLLLYAFCIIVFFVVMYIVSEKERKLKHALHLVGVDSAPYWLAWFVTYLVIYAVLSLILLLLLKLPISSIIVYPKGNFGLLYLMLLVGGINLIVFSFMLVPFFDRAVLAGIIAISVVGGTSFFYMALAIINNSVVCVSNAVYWVCCLLGNLALVFAIDRSLVLENLETGLHWNTLTLRVNGKLSVLDCLIMLVVDTVVYALLALYFDKVIPTEYGTQLHPLFFLRPSFWFGNSGYATQNTNNNKSKGLRLQRRLSRTAFDFVMNEQKTNPDVEEVPEHVRAQVGVITHNLCKQYKNSSRDGDGRKLAVNNLSMAIYKNEITAILGHNGAGKTTAIKLLTGQTAATSGQAYLLDYNIADGDGRRKIQAQLGVCPQENVLWDSLSVGEHLVIFGLLRNLTWSDARQAAISITQELDLTEKWSSPSRTLSGGQKRRLCLAIGLIGSPAIVFLDEPSSGVDPQSRRKMWEVLKRYKQHGGGRCIVLTTHSMYEADVLADRKLIVANGRLRCAGSSLFLKNRFGIGYHLLIDLDVRVLARTAEREKQIKLLQADILAIVPEAQFPRNWSPRLEQLNIDLPKEQVGKFPELFELLESQKWSGSPTSGIKDVSLSMVSLEEVFLRLGSNTEEDEKIAAHSNGAVLAVLENNNHPVLSADGVNPVTPGVQTVFRGGAKPTVNGKPHAVTLLSKLYAMTLLRLRMWWRQPVRYVVQMVIIILFFVIGLLTEMLIVKLFHDFVARQTTVDFTYWRSKLLTREQNPVVIVADSDTDFETAKAAMSAARLRLQRGNDSTYSMMLDNYQIADQRRELYVGADVDHFSNASTYTVWYNGTFRHSMAMALNTINSIAYQAATGRKNDTIKVTSDLYNVLKLTEQTEILVRQFASILAPFVLGVAFGFLAAFVTPDVVTDRQVNARRILRLSNVSFSLQWLPFFVVHILCYIVPLTIVVLIITALWGPQAFRQDSAGAFLFALQCYVYIVFLLLFVYCFSFAYSKRTTALSCQIIINMLFALIAVIFSTIINLDGSFREHHWWISLCLPCYNFVSGVFLTLTHYYTQAAAAALRKTATQAVGHEMVARVTGQMDMTANLTVADYIADFDGRYRFELISSAIQIFVLFVVLLCLEAYTSGEATVWIAALFGTSDRRQQLEAEFNNADSTQAVNHPHPFSAMNEDDDVAHERDAVCASVRKFCLTNGKTNQSFAASAGAGVVAADNGSIGSGDNMNDDDPQNQLPALNVCRIRKTYSGSVFQRQKHLVTAALDSEANNDILSSFAVKDVSFRLLPNEVFGLLGPNGAGKTTIMSMLVRENLPTAGHLFVQRYDAYTQWDRARRLLGYCPQFDALWDNITVEEHLQLYALLRGHGTLSAELLEMAHKLGLGEHWRKPSRALSGGTKRKLSFLISCVVPGLTALLDEPSTGMDPVSARKLWDIIKQHFNTSVAGGERYSTGAILTTHYMEEADALCSRIGIMVKGYIRCIGTSSHLRNKYGSGYRLEMKLVDASTATRRMVCDIIMQNFPSARLLNDESLYDRLMFEVPQAEAMPLSRSFAVLESLRSSNNDNNESAQQAGSPPLSQRKVVEYILTQTSLEQVFIKFAKEQES